jgi:hypothetical protein
MNVAPIVEKTRKKHIIRRYLSLKRSINPTLLAFSSPNLALVAESRLKDATIQIVKITIPKQEIMAARSRSSVLKSTIWEIIGIEKKAKIIAVN